MPCSDFVQPLNSAVCAWEAPALGSTETSSFTNKKLTQGQRQQRTQTTPSCDQTSSRIHTMALVTHHHERQLRISAGFCSGGKQFWARTCRWEHAGRLREQDRETTTRSATKTLIPHPNPSSPWPNASPRMHSILDKVHGGTTQSTQV